MSDNFISLNGSHIKLTRHISIGHDELAITTSIGISVPDDLKQHARKTLGVAFRAVTGHDKVRESNVVLVVGAISCVTSLPAGREHDLETDTICAVGIEVRLIGHEVAIQGALRSLGIVEAVEANGALSQDFLGSLTQRSPERFCRIWLSWVTSSVGAAVSVASDHAEIGRESLDVVSIEKIVSRTLY